MAASSVESVSFSFIHSNDVPVFRVSFRDARLRADPESRGFDHIWIPGSPAKRGRPGMTALCCSLPFPVSPQAQNALRRAHNRTIALTIIDRLFSCELP